MRAPSSIPPRPSLAPPRPSMPPLDAAEPAFDSYRRRRLVSVVLAVLAVLGATVYLFWPLFAALLGGESAYFEWDVPEQYWPDLVYFCDSVRGGELPYWNPYDRGGYPYYADPQAATFHPSTWAICALGGPSPGLGWATARVPLAFASCGLFGLLWLRRLECTWSGAILGAVLLMAAPFMRNSWELNLSLGFAHAPLLLWSLDRLAVERRTIDGVVFAAVAGALAWMGSPPALWLASTIGGLYFVFRLGEQTRRHGVGILVGGLPAFLAAGCLAIGLAGVVLFPGGHLAEHSVQAGHDLASIRGGAIEGDDRWALLFPRSGNHLYVGWIALALGGLAFLRDKDRLPGFFFVMAGLSVLMTFGGGFFELAFHALPGVRHFRGPQRYEAWLGVSAAALAAFGLTAIVRRGRSKQPRRDRLISGGVAILGVVALVLLPDQRAPGALTLAAGLFIGARTLPREWSAGAAPFGLALAALVLADVGQALPAERHMRRGDGPIATAAESRILDVTAPEAPTWRFYDEFGISCRAGTRHRRRDLRGYQDPLSLAAYERVVGSMRDAPGLLAQHNVRWVLLGPHFIHGFDRGWRPPEEALAARGATTALDLGEGRRVLELPDALPFAYFVPLSRARAFEDRASALARLRELAPARVALFDGAGWPADAEATLPTGALELDAAAGSTPIEDLAFGHDHLAFAIEAPSDGVVVVNEAYYPGWGAQVHSEGVSEARDEPVFRVNGFVRGVFVGAGRQRVLMRFRPDEGVFWRELYLLSAMVALLALLAALYTVGRRRFEEWRLTR